MATHVKVLGALFVAIGVLGIVAALFSSLAFGALADVAGASGDEGALLGQAILGFTGFALTVALLIAAAPAVLCGWGLLTFRPWARLLGIVLAAVALLAFPYGTLFGIYALWVLFSKRTEPVFGG